MTDTQPISHSEQVSIMNLMMDGSDYLAPHCDPRVLHAPGVCKYCDSFSTLQSIRIVWGVAFTDDPAPEGKVPCPAMHARPDTYKHWPGNKVDGEGYENMFY